VAENPGERSGGTCGFPFGSYASSLALVRCSKLPTQSVVIRDAQGIGDLIGCCRAAVATLMTVSVITSGWSIRTM
jgi:hypothetical protein